ncbi:protein of unknown function [Methylacidimicrobium sp. AP8]|nr:protein of unknown function [Methylacidimicrobium sp. AP8]
MFLGKEEGQHLLPFSRREEMLEPEEVGRMVALQDLGWGTKRIARELAAISHQCELSRERGAG